MDVLSRLTGRRFPGPMGGIVRSPTAAKDREPDFGPRKCPFSRQETGISLKFRSGCQAVRESSFAGHRMVRLPRRLIVIDSNASTQPVRRTLKPDRVFDLGLLTWANHVIHLSRWWNPAVEDQCNGRALRIGQTRPVTVHVPLATLSSQSRSFDQNLDALLKRKRRLMHEALLPPEATESERQQLLAESPAGASI